MLKQRLLVAAIFLPVFVWMIFLPQPAVFFIFAILCLAVAVFEFGSLVQNRGLKFSWPVALAAVTGMNAVAAFQGQGSAANLPDLAWLWGLAMAALLVLCLLEIAGRNSEASFQGLCATLFAILLLGGVGSFVMLLRRLPLGPWWIVLLFGCNWCYDAGAFFFGSWFGRRPLAPQISPAKTWEGFIGGLAVTAVLAVCAQIYLLPRAMGFTPAGAAGLGLGLGVLAQAGDLVESRLKRWSGIKDSAGFIPGHGGVLDKFDSSFFTAPVLYLIARLLLP